MADNSNRRRESENSKSSIAKKIFVPVAAAAGSALANYAAKRAPQFFEQKVFPLVEEKVVPKLRSASSSAGDVARDVPGRAKSAAGGAGGVAQDLADRARSLGPGGDGDAGRRRRAALSTRELEQRRNQRATARAARRKALST